MLEFLGALLLIGLLFVALLVFLGIKLARKVVRTARGLAAGFGPAMPNLSALPDPRWARFSVLLDRSQRGEARIARERIRAFVGEGRLAPLGAHESQLLISCEKRVPELLDACLERCSRARPGERCDYAAATLERLVRIGEEAEDARRSLRQQGDGRLLTMQTYFDTVVSRDKESVPLRAGPSTDEGAPLR